ncbi:MAG: DUF1844 domain-containing protein [Candidatus Omnitrophica bacterium]|nr:DUF1844 domain-containing protein [Candidatus Omnitrophota bacterium]
MDEQVKKRVDESWKEQAEREKQQVDAKTQASPSAPGPGSAPEAGASRIDTGEEQLQARFDLFVSGLAMEALIAMGEMPHPTTRRQQANLPQAKYLVDLLGILEEKTKGNLSVDESRLLSDALYQLRMRYLTKAGPAG